MNHKTLSLLTPILAALLAATAGAAPTPTDPFYLSLLEDGKAAYHRGDHRAAREDLRIACFGLMDEPTRLGECLTFLGLAQASLDDTTALNETYSRLLEVERRFHGYSDADLAAADRGAFEQVLATRIPPEALRASDVFGNLVDAKAEAQLRALPPRERVQALELRIGEDPEDMRWRHLAAETYAELDRWQQVVGETSAILARTNDVEAKCLRGLAQAELENWQPAVADLAVCERSAQSLEHARALLRARLELEQYDEAQQLVESLPASIAQDNAVARMSRQLDRRVQDSRTSAQPAEVAQREIALPSPDELRERLRSARSRDELVPVLTQAERLADANPGSQDIQHLTAEIAYRAGRWQESVEYFRRGGDPGDEQPSKLFYYAVALYESGDTAQAAVTLRRCLPNLKRTEFVKSYVERILGSSG